MLAFWKAFARKICEVAKLNVPDVSVENVLDPGVYINSAHSQSIEQDLRQQKS